MAAILALSAALSALEMARVASNNARQNSSNADLPTGGRPTLTGVKLGDMVNDEAKELLRPVLLELDIIFRKNGLGLDDLNDRVLKARVIDKEVLKKANDDWAGYLTWREQAGKKVASDLLAWERNAIYAALVDWVEIE